MKAWAKIAQFLHMRNGKQCRERYRNHLRPELCKGEWSVEEDTEIWNRVREVGTKWAAISELFMPTRTDNDIKNRWNSIIRKPKAPGGREWTHQETEQRMAFIGNAARTQVPCRPPPRAATCAPPPPRAAAPAGPPPNAPAPTLTRRAAALRRSGSASASAPGRSARRSSRSSTSRARRTPTARWTTASSVARPPPLPLAERGVAVGGALAEGALGASAPNSESLRRYFREAAGDSAGTPAPVTAAAVGRRRRRRAPPRRAARAAAPRRSWGRRAPSSARRAPSKSPPRPRRRRGARRRGRDPRRRPRRRRHRRPAVPVAEPMGPTARRSRRRAAMGGRAPTRRRRTSARGSRSRGARRGRGRVREDELREGDGEGLCEERRLASRGTSHTK